MLVFILYDIASNKEGDRRRARIVKLLERTGLYRVQKSVFLGNLNRNELDELSIVLEKMIEEASKKDRAAAEDKVYIFPVSKDDFENAKIIGQGFNSFLVTDEIKALVL